MRVKGTQITEDMHLEYTYRDVPKCHCGHTPTFNIGTEMSRIRCPCCNRYVQHATTPTSWSILLREWKQ